ncbi:hypothetical protein EDC04DRAFT_2606692 [Pisolithus marmoratus]|nr:hypothetical protein EDC04DRAFT_2606692 [Pisolithus marmoratus]
MSHKGIRHYSPYNLRSRGSHQTFECLPTPSTFPTRPRNSSPGHVDTLCHLVLLDFVCDCANVAEAVYDEQQRVARVPMRDNGSMLALDAGESISDNELKLFHPVQMQYVKELMECTDGVMNDLERRRIPTAFWDLTFNTKEVLTIKLEFSIFPDWHVLEIGQFLGLNISGCSATHHRCNESQ